MNVIVIVALLMAAILSLAVYVGLRLYTYYLVDGIRKAVEVIEIPNLEGS